MRMEYLMRTTTLQVTTLVRCTSEILQDKGNLANFPLLDRL